jgi:DNA-binding GntR family transcriptional regulator
VKRLLIEGFLTRSPGDGLRVTGLQADEVEQIFRIRLMLESYGARRAAQYASEAEIARLFRLANEISARTPPKSEDDYDAITHANAEFHRTIVQAARSQRLGSMLSLAVNMGLVVRTYRMYSEHDMVRQAGHHHDIAEAIAARDPEWAEAAMSNHVIAAAATTRASKAEAFLGNPARTPGRNAPAPRKQV